MFGENTYMKRCWGDQWTLERNQWRSVFKELIYIAPREIAKSPQSSGKPSLSSEVFSMCTSLLSHTIQSKNPLRKMCAFVYFTILRSCQSGFWVWVLETPSSLERCHSPNEPGKALEPVLIPGNSENRDRHTKVGATEGPERWLSCQEHWLPLIPGSHMAAHGHP